MAKRKPLPNRDRVQKQQHPDVAAAVIARKMIYYPSMPPY